MNWILIQIHNYGLIYGMPVLNFKGAYQYKIISIKYNFLEDNPVL